MTDETNEYPVDDMLASQAVRTADDLAGGGVFFQTGDDWGAYTDKGQELHKSVLFAINYSAGLRKYLEELDFSDLVAEDRKDIGE